MSPALLTAVDSTNHVHIIIGSNSLAGARCSKSIEVGAKPKLIAPGASVLHYGLVKRIEAGEVTWIKAEFEDQCLTALGRAEVEGVVDAVFVTLARQDPLSMISNVFLSELLLTEYKDLTSQMFVDDCVFQ
jgi:uroporphyrin-III C-methyltransferase